MVREEACLAMRVLCRGLERDAIFRVDHLNPNVVGVVVVMLVVYFYHVLALLLFHVVDDGDGLTLPHRREAVVISLRCLA